MYRVLLCTLATSALVTTSAHAQSPAQYPYYSAPSYSTSQAPAQTQQGRTPARYAVRGYSTDDGTPTRRATQMPAQQVQAPARYAARGHLGGGFIEAIFGGGGGSSGQYANPYGSQGYVENPYSRFAVDPRFQRQVVAYDGHEAAGTIIVDTDHYYLYLVQGGGKAIRYGVGVGRPGFTWSGVHSVSAKREWPDWRPPDEMLRRKPELPHYMAGGPDNPLGARALYLGDTLYRIHGSNEPNTIGTQVSSGCIRMRNEDVIDLYERVGVGTKVVVL